MVDEATAFGSLNHDKNDPPPGTILPLYQRAPRIDVKLFGYPPRGWPVPSALGQQGSYDLLFEFLALLGFLLSQFRPFFAFKAFLQLLVQEGSETGGEGSLNQSLQDRSRLFYSLPPGSG